MPQPGLAQYNLSVAITPSDTVDFVASGRTVLSLCDAFVVGVAGNVTGVQQDGSTVLFTAVPVGVVIPARLKRINATGTAATGIVALYQV